MKSKLSVKNKKDIKPKVTNKKNLHYMHFLFLISKSIFDESHASVTDHVFTILAYLTNRLN